MESALLKIYTSGKTVTNYGLDMISAAEKVFAIPELLEAILLDLPWHHLFVLHSTNTTFRDTMQHSLKLRRRMHLEYKRPGDDCGIELPESLPQYLECSLIEQLVANNSLLLGPFELRRRGEEDDFPRDLVAIHHSLLISLRSPFQAASLAIDHDKSDTVVHEDEPTPSWRDIKLTHERESIRFDIQVNKIQKEEYDVDYSEEYKFAAGEGTLGDIADIVNSIQLRTVDQHNNRSQELFEEYMEKASFRWRRENARFSFCCRSAIARS